MLESKEEDYVKFAVYSLRIYSISSKIKTIGEIEKLILSSIANLLQNTKDDTLIVIY